MKYLLEKFGLIFLSLIAVLSAMYLVDGEDTYRTRLISLLPLTYFVCLVITNVLIVKSRITIFHYILFSIGFARYVLHPVISEYLGGYIGRSHVLPADDSFDTAVIIMCYELISVSTVIILIDYLGKVQKFDEQKIPTKLLGLRPCYILLMVSFILLAMNPQAFFLINFFVPIAPDSFDMESLPTFSIFAGYFFIIVKQIFFVNLIFLYSCRYKDGSNKYLYLSMMLFVINVGVFFGTNRTDILISAIVSYIFFFKYFGQPAKRALLFIVPITILLVTVVTSARQYEKSETAGPIVHLNDYLQTYFGGVYNVAIGVEVEDYYPESSSLNVLFFDFFRPMLGVNLIVKNWDVKYSNIYFNDRLWRHVDRRSQIMPMVAQSYLYFGMAGAPVLSILFVFLYYFLSRYNDSFGTYEELKFFITLCMARLGFLFGQNTMNLINDLSMNLFLVAFILLFFKILFRGCK